MRRIVGWMLLFTLVLAGCTSKQSQSMPSETAGAPVNESRSLATMGYPVDPWQFHVRIDQIGSNKVGDRTMEVETSIDFDSTLKVASQDEDIVEIHYQITGMEGTSTYGFEPWPDSTFLVRVDKVSGAVKLVEGMPARTVKTSNAGGLSALNVDQFIRKTLIAIGPKGKSSWAYDSVITYDGSEDGDAIGEWASHWEARYGRSGSSAGVPVNVTVTESHDFDLGQFRLTGSGSGKGTYTLDKETGWPIEGSLRTEVTAELGKAMSSSNTEVISISAGRSAPGAVVGKPKIVDPAISGKTYLDFFVRGVAYGAGKFVVIGRGGEIFTAEAATPLKWEDHGKLPGSEEFYTGSLLHALDQFWIFSPEWVWSSPDGVSWNRNPLGSPDGRPFYRMQDAAYGDGQFMLVGYSHEDDGLVWTSTDGQSWTLALRIPDRYFYQVEFGDGRWVVLSGSTAFASVDTQHWSEGTSWNELPLENASLAYANGDFFAIGDVIGPDVVSVSVDGQEWETIPIARSRVFPVTGLPVFLIVDEEVSSVSSDLRTRAPLENPPLPSDVWGDYLVTFGDGILVAVRNNAVGYSRVGPL